MRSRPSQFSERETLMITTRKIVPLAALCALTSLSGTAHAQWASYTVQTPTTALNGSFNVGGAYSGGFKVYTQNFTDGGNDGIPGIVPVSYNQLTTSFTNNLPTNPGPAFDYFGVTYNNSGDSYDVILDFSGLQNGYLPMGTIVGFLDIDILEDMQRLVAWDSSNNFISNPWLTPMGGQAALLDYSSVGGDSTGSITGPVTAYNSGAYDFFGQSPNWDAAFLGYTTTQDVSMMLFHFAKSNASQFAPGTGGYGLALGVVPEPTSMAVLAFGAAGLIARRRKAVS